MTLEDAIANCEDMQLVEWLKELQRDRNVLKWWVDERMKGYDDQQYGKGEIKKLICGQQDEVRDN